MILQENKYTNGSGNFPNWTAIDASGAGLTDGSEYAALPINDGYEAFQQACMDYASGNANAPTGAVGTPNAVSEAAGVCQLLQALQYANGIGPGMGVIWWLDDDPSVTGHRVLLLEGQGILHANYPGLLAAVYVGDANNAAVAAGGGFFYKSSDAAGTVPDTTATGVYLQLPDARGYALRGLDAAAAVDPDGASRFLGDVQTNTMQGHWHQPAVDNSGVGGGFVGFERFTDFDDNTTSDSTNQNIKSPITDGINGAPRTSSETRMSNLSTKFGITY